MKLNLNDFEKLTCLHISADGSERLRIWCLKLLSKAIPYAQNLEDLTIDINHSADGGLLYPQFGHLPKLKKLNYSMICASPDNQTNLPDSLSQLSQLDKLLVLELEFNYILTLKNKDYLSSLSSCHSLLYLTIKDTNNNLEKTEPNPYFTKFLLDLNKLKYLIRFRLLPLASKEHF